MAAGSDDVRRRYFDPLTDVNLTIMYDLFAFADAKPLFFINSVARSV